MIFHKKSDLDIDADNIIREIVSRKDTILPEHLMETAREVNIKIRDMDGISSKEYIKEAFNSAIRSVEEATEEIRGEFYNQCMNFTESAPGLIIEDVAKNSIIESIPLAAATDSPQEKKRDLRLYTNKIPYSELPTPTATDADLNKCISGLKRKHSALMSSIRIAFVKIPGMRHDVLHFDVREILVLVYSTNLIFNWCLDIAHTLKDFADKHKLAIVMPVSTIYEQKLWNDVFAD